MSEPAVQKYWAVVPAAGSGQRMQASRAKQYLEINGKTIIETALRVLLNCEKISEIVVCTAADDRIWPTLSVSGHPKIRTVEGGASRAQSVLNGLLSRPQAADNEWVLVHDAARPCLTDLLLEKLIDELKDDPLGGILATPARDTLKLIDPQQQKIQKTLDRSLVWQAQTPQMFRFGLLRAALEQAIASGVEITDEAAAMELVGYQPRLVEGDSANLKVTVPEDLQLATFLLSR